MTSSVVVASPRKLTNKRKALMFSCAAAAMAAGVLMPQKARAQAFNAPSIPEGGNIASAGTATRTFTGGTSETVTIGTSKTIINWVPDESGTGATIDFLPGGNTATFQGDTGVTHYTVLNRVVPDGSRAISLDGNVIAKLPDGSTGGNIWFYSPNGIVVGSSAQFDVGGLLLTTADISDFTNSVTGFSFSSSASNPTASIQIASGAKINALQQNSYVALVAPNIVQGGDVRVKGSAAYVAAEQVTMTFNQGLFDVSVPFGGGTGESVGIDHTGSTTGPASTSATDYHRIYMVAVPKNQAMSMLLAGDVGFDAPISASVENGQIVISAGANITNPGGNALFVGGGNLDTTIDIRTGNYTSDLKGRASGDITVVADEGDIAFAGDLDLYALRSNSTSNINVGAFGYDLSVGGDLTLTSDAPTYPSEVNLYAWDGGTVDIDKSATLVSWAASDGVSPGSASLYASGGSIDIGQVAMLYTAAPAYSANSETVSADSYAGDISVEAYSGGTITTGGMNLQAFANGQDNLGGGDGTAGSGYGGDIDVTVSTGGKITVNGSLNANADGVGGRMYSGSIAGGTGDAGTIQLYVGYTGFDEFDVPIPTSVKVTGDVNFSANGGGGSYFGSGAPAVAAGGDGLGGNINVRMDGEGSIDIDGHAWLLAAGAGGYGQTGGNGTGGVAGVDGIAGTADMGPEILIDAHGNGGAASFGFGGDGGDGQGGTAYLQARVEEGDIEIRPSAMTIMGGSASLNVDAYGGIGGQGDGIDIAAGAGGNARGGTWDGVSDGSGGAFAIADSLGGKLTLGNVSLNAVAAGGAGGTGGSGQSGGVGGDALGGTATAGTYRSNLSSNSALATVSFGNVGLYASGTGGAGGAGNNGAAGGVQGIGGNGTGGLPVAQETPTTPAPQGGALFAARGTVTAGSVELLALGTGGAGSTGGSGIGGDVKTLVLGSGSLITTGDLKMNAVGTGGNGGTAGSGLGGFAGLGVYDTGTIESKWIFVDSGGVGGTGGVGGSGTGGESYVEVLGTGKITATKVQLWSPGYGGGSFGDGGSAQGGWAHMLIQGSVNAPSVGANAFGWGGNSTVGIGGSALAGDATINVSAGGMIAFGTELYADSQTYGGNGAINGGGQAGSTDVESHGISAIIVDGGTVTGAGALTVSSNAHGGINNEGGGVGSVAYGGVSSLTALSGGSVSAGTIALSAIGFAGDAESFGGDAIGGKVSLLADGGSITGTTTIILGAKAEAGSASTIGSIGGQSLGGTAELATLNGGTISTGGFLNLDSAGFGGNALLEGGIGDAGSSTISIDSGQVSAGSIGNYSNAWGGDGLSGGDAFGGEATIVFGSGGGTLAVIGEAQIEAVAFGGDGSLVSGGTGGIGGFGNGGDALVDVGTGATANFGSMYVDAGGEGGRGGNGATGGDGGDGTAGNSTITVAGTFTSTGGSGNYSIGKGGAGGTGGVGGSGSGGAGGVGSGGAATLTVDGTMTAGYYDGYTRAFGGAGGNGTVKGLGGDASGSDNTVTIAGTATINGGLLMTAFAEGGAGSSGGDAQGGTSLLTVTGLLTATGNVQSSAQAAGGAGTTGAGGNAFGSDATLDVQGEFHAGSIRVLSRGTGGNGASGGSGEGGDAFFSVTGIASGNDTVVEANGIGGNASGNLQSGGTGNAGSASVVVDNNGQLAFGSGTDIVADAFGGSSTNGHGGDANAQTASVTVNGTLTATGSLAISADGEGGDGATGGGYGQGGEAYLDAASTSSVDLGTDTLVTATGSGGSSTGTGAGGVAYGGYAHLTARGESTVSANDLLVRANAEGGSGVTGGDAFAAENIEGYGGAYLSAESDGSLTLTGQTEVRAAAQGGDGTTGEAGSAFGGTAVLAASFATVNGGDVLMDVTGLTGVGASGATGEGGNAILTANGGPLTGADVTILASGSTDGGRVDLDIINGGTLTLDSLTVTANSSGSAGDILVDVSANSSADLGVASLTANGGNAPGSGEEGIEVDIIGTLKVTSMTLVSSDNIRLGTQLGGQILVDSSIEADSQALVELRGDGNGGLIQTEVLDLAGANLLFSANVQAADILLTLPGDYSIGALPFASNSLTITAGGDISALESVFYSNSLALNAGGDLSLIDVFVGGDLALSAVGSITAGDLTAVGSIAADAGGDLNADVVTSGATPPNFAAALAFAAGEDVVLSADGDLSVESVSSGGAISLDAGGALTAGPLAAVTSITGTAGTSLLVGNSSAGGALALTATDTMQTGTLSGQSVALTAGGSLSAGDIDSGSTVTVEGGSVTLGDIDATGAVNVTADGMASFLGVVSAPNITISSGDINIADGGAVGLWGVTDLITFNAVTDGSVYLGGPEGESSAGDYHFSEAGDVSATAITFNAVAANGGAAPDIVVGDAQIEGSQAEGVSHVTLNTDGAVIVEGQVDFIGAAAEDSLAINAGTVIEVITDTGGGISMTDNNGDLSGTLELTAHDIWVADQSVIDQLEANPNFNGLEDALAANNGEVNPDGSIRAGGVTATMLGSSFLVQNTGTADALAGLTVGDSGLTIVNNGSDPATVIVYGQQVRGDGTVLTGDAFFDEVAFGGDGGFDNVSNVNGCEVGGGCGPSLPDDPAVTGVEAILGPIGLMGSPSDVAEAGGAGDEGNEEEDEEDDGEDSKGGVDASVGLINTGPVSIDRPIEEPVTSGSDAPGGGN